MLGIIVQKILIGFVADMVNPACPTSFIDGSQVGFRIHDTGRVVRGHRDDGSGFLRNSAFNGIYLQVSGVISRYSHGNTVRNPNRHLLIEVKGLGQNDLVPGVANRQQHIQKSHIAASRYHDLPALKSYSVLLLQLFCKR